MQNATMDALKAVLRSDGTVSAADRQRMATLLRSGPGEEQMTDRILRRSEAARLLGRSPKALDRLAANGVLKKVVFPNYRRAAGFRLSDVAALIAGGKIG